MDQEAFFTSPLADHLTLRDLACELGVPLDAVVRAVDRGRLRHDKRHGVVRLWKRERLAEVRAALFLPLPTGRGPG